MIAGDGGKLSQDQAFLKFRGFPIAHAQGLHNFLPSGFSDSIHALPYLGNILLRQRSRLGNKNHESMRKILIVAAIPEIREQRPKMTVQPAPPRDIATPWWRIRGLQTKRGQSGEFLRSKRERHPLHGVISTPSDSALFQRPGFDQSIVCAWPNPRHWIKRTTPGPPFAGRCLV